MDPLDFLQTCTRLSETSSRHESDGRTILSRAYYAFFLLLRDGIALRDDGFRASMRNDASDHSRVREYLRGTRFTPEGRRNIQPHLRVSWYERYEFLFSWREVADYRMEFSTEDILNAVRECQVYISRLEPLARDFVRR